MTCDAEVQGLHSVLVVLSGDYQETAQADYDQEDKILR